jgi:HTH-type transcriptional regulator/antitoxin HigA
MPAKSQVGVRPAWAIREPNSIRLSKYGPSSVARLSWSDEGPRLAKEFLAKHGITLVVVHHLPRTYLDGAALKLGDGTPVVGLTLRCDRVDGFWFCLLHELAHLGCHMELTATSPLMGPRPPCPGNDALA